MITIDDIRNAALTGDKERLTPVLREYLEANPDMKTFALSAVDKTPRDVLTMLVRKYPEFALLALLPQATTFILTMQSIIKETYTHHDSQ